MHNPATHIAICITGWHYNESFYATISQVPHVTPFVISHKPRREVPAYVFTYVPAAQVLFKPNRGYDWGCYQQFLDTELWRGFDYIFFMHDDIEIKGDGFLYAAIAHLMQGAAFVGNGRNSAKTDWPGTHHLCYAHSRWKPADHHVRHETIRGSFIATTSAALHMLGGLEVFWDRFRLDTRFGNWSLIASCGKMQSIFGDTTFHFLSDTYRDSPYLRELERGDTRVSGKDHNPVQHIAYTSLLAVCAWYMSAYFHVTNRHFKCLLTALVRPYIALFAK